MITGEEGGVCRLFKGEVRKIIHTGHRGDQVKTLRGGDFY